jgi:effector-binding domain-containing protein|tara:strand:+ start:1105 stop:1680 length:576 start_codon:yes stop_codon:yes gene_type:complete
VHKKKKSKISAKRLTDIKNTIPSGISGIGAYTSHFNNWNSIENFSKTHGLYTPMDVRELIFKNSPLKKIGDINLEIVRIIEDTQLRKKDLSFHAACLENFSELCILIAVNPYEVHMGANWENLEKTKNKNFSRRNYPKQYARVIETIRSRYQRVVSENRAVYAQWYKQNKKNKETLNFVKATLKILYKQKK